MPRNYQENYLKAITYMNQQLKKRKRNGITFQNNQYVGHNQSHRYDYKDYMKRNNAIITYIYV